MSTKERPILFSGPMVRAILEGKKTQTRRVVSAKSSIHAEWPLTGLQSFGDGVASFHVQNDVDSYTTERVNCSCGRGGDRLWVREIFCPEGDAGACWYRAGVPVYDAGEIVGWNDYPYRLGEFLDPPAKMTWKPSIFMPRWASRIMLEVIGVRAERIQDISYDDCCIETGSPLKWTGEGPEPYHRDMHAIFRDLWDGINARRGYSWESNPFVWRIEFRKVDK